MKEISKSNDKVSPPGVGGKQLLLIRHAKSDWGSFSLPDFERPLNSRGKSDAPVMAQRLLHKEITMDAFISSPAKRAKKTASIFAREYNRSKDEIILIPELYEARVDTFFEVISKVDDKFGSIAVFSHNNGLTDFANLLTDVRIDNIPTCGIFAIKINSNQWADIRNAKKEFWFFDCPKQGED